MQRPVTVLLLERFFQSMTRIRRSILWTACATALSACDGVNAPERISVTTDETVYVRPVDGEVPVRGFVTNATDSLIALVGCPSPPSFVVEQYIDGEWRDHSSRGGLCLGIHTPQRADVAPGTTFEFIATFSRAGQYRFRVLLGPRWGDPDVVALSTQFNVQ